MATAHFVTLTWAASVDAVDGYLVFRGTAAGQETTQLTPAPITALTFTDNTALVGEDFYVVKSSLGGVLSVVSNEVSVSLPPAPPTDLVISAHS